MYVEHDSEFRVYVVGDEEVVVRFRALERDNDTCDFRNIDPSKVSCEQVNSKEEGLSFESLHALTERLGLNYCCFDVARSGEKNVLLDVNPAGSWAYIEHDHGIDLTDLIIRALVVSRIEI